MKSLSILVAAATLALSLAPAGAQVLPLKHRPPPVRHMVPIHRPIRRPIPVRGPHLCPVGQSWQAGCLVYGPRQPGQLVPICLKQGFGCFRAPQPIQ